MDDDTSCPVCQSEVEKPTERDYGDKKRFACQRCGTFEVSGSALAMLPGRLGNDPKRRAQLSYGIRKAIAAKPTFMVSSSNLDELLATPLPSIPEQKELLIRLIARELDGDELGTVPLPWNENLVGILGTLDTSRVQRLIDRSVKDDLLFVDDSGHTYGISDKGWSLIREKERRAADSHAGMRLDYGAIPDNDAHASANEPSAGTAPVLTQTDAKQAIADDAVARGTDTSTVAVDLEGAVLQMVPVPPDIRSDNRKALRRLLAELDSCAPLDADLPPGSNLQRIPLSSEAFDVVRSLAAASYETVRAPRLSSRIKSFLEQVREVLEELSRTLEAATDVANNFGRLMWALKGTIIAIGALIALL